MVSDDGKVVASKREIFAIMFAFSLLFQRTSTYTEDH